MGGGASSDEGKERTIREPAIGAASVPVRVAARSAAVAPWGCVLGRGGGPEGSGYDNGARNRGGQPKRQ